MSALDLAFCIDNVIQLIKINVLMILTRFYNKESALRTCLLKEFRFRQKLAGMSECLLLTASLASRGSIFLEEGLNSLHS